MDARAIVRELDRRGLLLLTDARLPNLVQCVTGESLSGSWWAHPRGKEIYAACDTLSAHQDVMVQKLVLGKVTFVHRRLWPALWAIATARAAWQTSGLPPSARALLGRVEKAGELAHGRSVADKGSVDELELRLLVHARQVHTARGEHARVLQTWSRWAEDADFEPAAMPLARARAEIEACVEREPASVGLWPWSPRAERSPKTRPRGRGATAAKKARRG